MKKKKLYSLLERIANAFEEQNRQNAEWIVLQTKWRQEDDTGRRIVAIHEQNAKRNEEWIEEQKRMVAEHLDKLKKEEGSDTTLAPDPHHQ